MSPVTSEPARFDPIELSDVTVNSRMSFPSAGMITVGSARISLRRAEVVSVRLPAWCAVTRTLSAASAT